MNIQMIPSDTLDEIANFKVGHLIEEKLEVTFIGIDISNVKIFTHKALWKEYRNVSNRKTI